MFSPYAHYRMSKPVNLGAAVDPAQVQPILAILSNRRAVMTASCFVATGACSPAADENADYWGMQAVQGESATSAYDDLMSYLAATPGAKVLVDTASVDKAGSGEPLVYVVAKDASVASVLSQGGSLQELPVSGTTSYEAPKKGYSGKMLVGVVLGAGAGALVAGPVGAVAGGIVGYAVTKA